MNEKIINIGIIGCGGIANGKHMPSLAKLCRNARSRSTRQRPPLRPFFSLLGLLP